MVSINTQLMFSHNSNEWQTPRSLFDELNKEFNFTLDPCSTHENHKCEKYYTKEDDGLSKNWFGEVVFVNPPYGKQIGTWVKKCYEEYLKGTKVVMLIPSRTDTKFFHQYIWKIADIRFIKGRLKFVNPNIEKQNSAPFPSMIVIYDPMPF